MGTENPYGNHKRQWKQRGWKSIFPSPIVLYTLHITARIRILLLSYTFLLPSAVLSAPVNPGRHVVLRQGISVPCLFGQYPKIFPNLLIGYLRIYLCGADVGVAHHPADGLNGNPVGETDFGRIGMSGHIVGQMAVQPADIPDYFQAPAQAGSGRHIKQSAVRTLSLVLLHDFQRNIQQFDTAFHFCLQTMDVYPF